MSYKKAINFTISTVGLQYNNNEPCQTRSVVVRMLDPLIVADVVVRKRCAVSLAFGIVKRMRSDTLSLSSKHLLITKLSS